MFAMLLRAANRKAVAAGLAVLATAGIGVAVAAPPDAPEETEVSSTFAIGSPEDLERVVEDAISGAHQQVDMQPTVPDPDGEEEVDVPPPPPRTSGDTSASVASSQETSPPLDSRFLPDGDSLDSDLLRGLLPDDAQRAEVAEGAEEVAGGVIARIEECVGAVVDQFASGFGFDGSGEADGSGFGAGASTEVGQSFATDIVEDVLPCVVELVEDAARCVSGLVDEILATVMSMDFGEMAGLAEVIVDELVDCVGGDLAS